MHPSRDLPEAGDGEQVEGEEDEGWYTTGHGSSTSTWNSPPGHVNVPEPTYTGVPSMGPTPDSAYMQMPRAMPHPYPQTVLPGGLGMPVAQTHMGLYSLDNPAPMPFHEPGCAALTHRDHQVPVQSPWVAGPYIEPFRPSSPSYGRTPTAPSFMSPPHRRSTIQGTPSSCCTPSLRESVVFVCGRPLQTKGSTLNTTSRRGTYSS
ncbi:hypothetical protein PENSPDRAFT_513390 [Peniophora sp. CONT]|nr:hypothetical protein PENSPDRAFT_513390 [Peniophora sp. CONT]